MKRHISTETKIYCIYLFIYVAFYIGREGGKKTNQIHLFLHLVVLHLVFD